jgi:integrase
MKGETREKILDELKAIGTLRPKAGLTYALQFYSKIARIGFGISRREMTRPRKELSPFIHAFSTFDRYLGIAKEFVQFCRKKGTTRLHKLSYDSVEGFLMEKITVWEVSRNTIETNVCALKNFFHVCCRHDLRDKLSSDYSRFKYLAKEGGAIHAFDNPERLIEKISKRDELSAVIAKLEHVTGARIHEVRGMEIMEDAIRIKGKGGKVRVHDFSFRLDELGDIKNLMARLEELSQGIDWQHYCQSRGSAYQARVKAACRSLGDEYGGAHGFRANYAQELLKKLEKRGLTDKEVERIITRDLGHERRSMARHYLSV